MLSALLTDVLLHGALLVYTYAYSAVALLGQHSVLSYAASRRITRADISAFRWSERVYIHTRAHQYSSPAATIYWCARYYTSSSCATTYSSAHCY